VNRERLVLENDAEVGEGTAAAVILQCECGAASCTDSVVVTPAEHALARGMKARLVSRAHAHSDGGRLLAVLDRYTLMGDD
jgi:hypothetical protein